MSNVKRHGISCQMSMSNVKCHGNGVSMSNVIYQISNAECKISRSCEMSVDVNVKCHVMSWHVKVKSQKSKVRCQMSNVKYQKSNVKCKIS